jgi:IS605 OrfB family transposase
VKQQNSFILPKRLWKACLDGVFTNIKTNWTNTKNKIKEAVNSNPNLTKDDRHYLRYILKSNVLLHSVLTRTPFDLPEKLSKYRLNLKYLNNLLCRYVRKYKTKKPKSNTSNYYVVDQFSQKGDKLQFQGRNFRKRIEVQLSDSREFTSQKIIRVISDTKIEIISTYDIPEKENLNSAIIGIDKGLKTLLNTSTDNKYGEDYSALQNSWQDKLNEKNKKRNKLRALSKKLSPQKSNNIKRFNLGTKKRDKVRNQQQSQLKSTINNAINKFLKTEKPKEIVIEDLSWSKFSDKGKRNNRNLASWMKGYLQERILYKCNIFGIKVVEVNPAYTSQTCHCCGKIGTRSGELFQCEEHGRLDADLNAAKNILSRHDDLEITTFTSAKRVKEILLGRFTVAGLSGATKTSEAGSYDVGLSLEERNVLEHTKKTSYSKNQKFILISARTR